MEITKAGTICRGTVRWHTAFSISVNSTGQSITGADNSFGLDLYQIFVMGCLTVIPYVASTVIPSWKTAITDPEEVMRT